MVWSAFAIASGACGGLTSGEASPANGPGGAQGRAAAETGGASAAIPLCPTELPALGTACIGGQVCSYVTVVKACCEETARASCLQGVWGIQYTDCDCLPPPTSGGGPAAGTGGAATGGAAGAGGASSSALLDPRGDGDDPGTDLLEAHVYLDESVLTARVRLAAEPLVDGGTLEIIFTRGTWSAHLEVTRQGAGYSVRWLSAARSLGFDPCTTAGVTAATGWLTVTLPAEVVPDASDVSVRVQVRNRGNYDRFDAGTVPLEPGRAPELAQTPACAPWGDALRPSTVQFRELSLGFDFGCGLDLAGQALCWGTAEAMAWVGQSPPGSFERIAVSNQWLDRRFYACGLRSNGSVECWGDRPPAVADRWKEMGDPFGCGVDLDGNIVCTEPEYPGEAPVAFWSGPFVDVVGGGTQVCGLTAEGSIACHDGRRVPQGSDFVAVELGNDLGSCGLRDDGTVDCAGEVVPPFRLRAMDGACASGSVITNCGLTPEGTPICWGAAGMVPVVAPGPFERIEVSSSGEAICGMRSDSTVDCWVYHYVAGNPVPAASPP